MKKFLLRNKSLNQLILLMFSVVCLLNINYTILRSARNALAVVDLGGGAGSIPWFELCGTMPGAVIMTLCLTYLLNRYSIERVFFIVLFAFVCFFIVFTEVIYPLLPLCKEYFSSPFLKSFVPFFASMIFFVMAELWKIALLAVLFWGLVNRHFPLESAKKYYAPLMLGGSVGTILAGPVISFCTSDWVSHQSWNFSLRLLMGVLALVSLGTAFCFSWLTRGLRSLDVVQTSQEDLPKKPMSVWSSVLVCCKSRYLLLLAWITMADYIAYGLGEIVFFDILKQKYPDPRQYCDYMGFLSLVNGGLTAFCAVFVTPYMLKKYKWVVASLVTPLCLLLTQGAFFFVLLHRDFSVNIEFAVILGSLFFCFVRAAKYTLFDTTKELSFLLLPPQEQMQGKLVVDGICGRLGRGSSSLVSLGLIQVFGSVLATAPLAASVALLVSFSCVIATTHLGFLVEKETSVRSSI